MRAILTALLLALVSVPALQAQHNSMTGPLPEPEFPRAEVAAAPAEVPSPAPAPLQAVQTRSDVVETETARQVSARNVLAIIGAVVVVVALVAFFN